MNERRVLGWGGARAPNGMTCILPGGGEESSELRRRTEGTGKGRGRGDGDRRRRPRRPERRSRRPETASRRRRSPGRPGADSAAESLQGAHGPSDGIPAPGTVRGPLGRACCCEPARLRRCVPAAPGNECTVRGSTAWLCTHLPEETLRVVLVAPRAKDKTAGHTLLGDTFRPNVQSGPRNR